MRKLLSNTWLVFLIALSVLFSNMYYSISTNEFHWFQRSGSIIVLLGILITARRVIRLGKDYRNEDWNMPDKSPEGRRVLLDDWSVHIIGPIIAFLGTIVWGYGDLLLKLIPL